MPTWRAEHSSVVALISQHFVKTARVSKELGAVLKDAWRQREIADYSDVAEFASDEAEAQLRDAEMFVAQVASILGRTTPPNPPR